MAFPSLGGVEASPRVEFPYNTKTFLFMSRQLFARCSFCLACLFCAMASLAQDVTVTGTVTDDTQQPLIGVTVKVDGTSTGVVTDLDGKYAITVPDRATLIFSYIGYKTLRQEVAGRKVVDVALESFTNTLDEMVVIGYGVQKKSDITGSISSVSGKDINGAPVSSTLQALQGRAAGVNIIQNSGAPGGGTTIKIRGTGTVNDADPLYVVDGFIVDDIDYLNPNDIANVEVFKDAASSAVYGSRAANGVVAITTKRGKEGKVSVTYDGYVGVSGAWKKIGVMDADNYALMMDYVNGSSLYSADGQLFMTKNADGSLAYDPAKYAMLDTIHRNSAGNWWDAVTRTGMKTQHGVSVSGGSANTQFLASASYYKENGIVRTSGYDRFNGRVNVNSRLAGWLTLQAEMAYANEGSDGIPEGESGILKQALFESPMQYLRNNVGYWYGSNPLANLDRYNGRSHQDRLNMNLSLGAKFLRYFDYQFKASYYTVRQVDDNFYEVWGLDEDFVMPSSLSSVYKKQGNTNKWEINNLLTFLWADSHHSVTVLAGQTAESYKYSWQESNRSGTPSNDPNFGYLSSAYTGDKTYGLDREWTSVGFIGRVNYSLDDTYLLQANVRVDGSSMFSKDNRWGVFPSVSLGWKFSNEKFARCLGSWLTSGKVRVGWGRLGNNRIDELSRYTYLTSGFNYPFGIGNSTVYEGSTATVLGNDGIKWEKNESWNAGVDLSFMGNRLLVTAEYFNRKTTDMLLRVPTVASAGLEQSPMTNAGAVRNYGWEVDAKWRDRIGKHWSYEIGFNFSWMRNKVTSLGTGNEPIYGAYLSEGSIVDYVTKTAVGQPIGSFYGYVTDGIFGSYEEVRASAQYEVGKNDFEQTTMPGDFRFKDLNGDNRITAEDRTYLGSPLPKYFFGIPLAVGYKGFDLSVFMQGQGGNKIFNVMDYYLYNAAEGNVYADIRSKHRSGQLEGQGRTFFPLNADATVPDLSNNDAPRNFRASDFFIQKGDYLRLKQVQLTYNFPSSLLSQFGIKSLALSLTAYNLLTITGYDGFDPEVGKVSGTERNNLSMGVDQGNYPQARSFTFGVKLGL